MAATFGACATVTAVTIAGKPCQTQSATLSARSSCLAYSYTDYRLGMNSIKLFNFNNLMRVVTNRCKFVADAKIP
jgi:hypothetical protein